MEVTSKHPSPILTDHTPVDERRIGISSSLLPYNQPAASTLPIPSKKPGKLDDVRSNGWLDAMKSSSPTSKRLMKHHGAGVTSDDADPAYCSWMLKHPSALKSFPQMAQQARNKKIAVFLDYDGTLSPIVDEPDRALLSTDMYLAVKNVAKHFPTAIISGRSRDKVYELVGLNELYYAGSHGMDIMGPVCDEQIKHEILTNEQGNEAKVFQPAKEFLPMIDEIFRTLVEITKDIKGANIENNKFCISAHYRNVDQKDWSTIAQSVHDILKNYPHLQLTHGRKVFEIRPAIDWNKGKAVEFLLDSLGLADNATDVLPIYIGDDRTDEDAFKILRERNFGFGVLVSAVPKDTNAFYSLRNTSEVMEFLKLLVSWKKMEEV